MTQEHYFIVRWISYRFSSLEEHKTSIYYVNSNNGFTRFKGGGKVKSVANRMVSI